MKKILVLILCYSSLFSYEQQDSIFINLDTSFMKTEYLLEKQIKLINPFLLSGNEMNDSVCTNDVFRFINDQFHHSMMKDTVILPDVLTLDSIVETYYSTSFTPIGLSIVEYDKFHDSSYQYNYFYRSGDQMFDSPGRIDNPYLQEYCIVSAIYSNTITTNSLTFSNDFSLRKNLFFNNLEIDSIKIDFDNSLGYIDLELDSIVSVNFNSDSTRNIKIKCYSGTQTFVSKNKLFINFEPIAPGILQEELIPTSEFFVDNPDYTGAKCVVWYSNCEEEIKRPFIIVEGFDPNVTPTMTYGELGREDYVKFLNDNADDFHQKLIENGYDVILVDFEDGGGDIIQNAETVEILINRLNDPQEFQIETAIRLVGASMGGVISRYALANMQQNNIDPNVNFWMTIDSPHQGANIPYAVRQAVEFNDRYMASFIPKEAWKTNKAGVNKTRSLAAHQMLISNECLYDELENQDVQEDFYQELHSVPFPDIYNTIALTCGSLNGVKQNSSNFDPNDRYFKHFTELEGNDLMLFISFLAQWYFPFSIEMETGHEFRALPASPDQNLNDDYLYWKQRIEINQTILWFGSWCYYCREREAKIWHTVDNPSYSFEIMSGGFREDAKGFYDGTKILRDLSFVIGEEHTMYGNYKQCFIPTASSLDLITTSSSSRMDYELWDDNINNLLNSNIVYTPFKKIYGIDNHNYPHAFAEYIEDATARAEMYNLLDDLIDNEIAPFNVLIQNETFEGLQTFESKETIEIGREVDQNSTFGDVSFEPNSVSSIVAGETIRIKDGTIFKSGTKSHLRIEDVFQSCNFSENNNKITIDKETDEELFNQNHINNLSISPNPTNSSINIEYVVAESGLVSLELYDNIGSKMLTLIDNKDINAGTYNTTQDLTNYASGQYLLVLKINGEVTTKQFIKL